MSDYPPIYSFNDYREYLSACIEVAKEKGFSLRQLAKKGDIGNPTYFQQVASGKRNLTVPMIKKLSAALALDEDEKEYLKSLVLYEHDDDADREKLLTTMKKLVRKASTVVVEEGSMNEHWLYGFVYVLAAMEDYPLSVDRAFKLIPSLATREEIEQAFDFLIKNGMLLPTDEPEPEHHG